MKPFGEWLKKLLFVTMKTNRQVLQHDEGHPVWPLSKKERGGALCVVTGFTWTFYRKQAKVIVKSVLIVIRVW